MQALKHCGMKFMVAPHEADAQVVYLALINMFAAVITGDSDLLRYGCPTVSVSAGLPQTLTVWHL